jgi:hypothetical protein
MGRIVTMALLCLALSASGCARPVATNPTRVNGSIVARSSPAPTKRPQWPTRIGAARLRPRRSGLESLFGPGLLDLSDGYGDGHYYVKSDGSATLLVSLGTDERLAAVRLTSGTVVPPRLGPVSQAHSKTFDSVRSAVDDLALGDNYAQVVGAFGAPDAETTQGATRTLEWNLGPDPKNPSGTAKVVLVAGRVQGIGFYSPE